MNHGQAHAYGGLDARGSVPHESALSPTGRRDSLTALPTTSVRARPLVLALVALLLPLPTPTRADPCPDSVVAYTPGADGGFGSEFLPDIVLGLPRGTGEFAASTDVVSLGDGGQIVLSFDDNAIVDGPGPDLRIFENPFRNGPSQFFREAGFMELSPDGLVWTRLPWDAASFAGLAGFNPVFANPINEIDPRTDAAGGDTFDLADAGLAEVRFVRIVDPGAMVADPGNVFPIRGVGKSGFDLDAMVALSSAEICGNCCDAVFDDALRADDLVTLLRAVEGPVPPGICGDARCGARSCGDTDRDDTVGISDVELCFRRALGHDVACATGECDLDGRLAVAAAAPGVAGVVEIPQAGSIQSGVGLVSGWRCSGGRLSAVFDGGDPVDLAYGTTREDTRPACGDADNAFALQWNYNLLGDGPHELRLLDGGVEFARVAFEVVTLGEPFRRGLGGTVDVGDHPAAGDGLTLDWQTAAQAFTVTAFRPRIGAVTARPSPAPAPGIDPTDPNHLRATAAAALEIPAPGSVQSGIGLVSGWRCTGGVITAVFDDRAPVEVAYGTTRRDTAGTCGDDNNAFVLLWNYSLLEDGAHTVRLLDDGVEFERSSFQVVTLGRPFWRDLEHSREVTDFPAAGDRVRLDWQTARQGFGITDFAPARPIPTPTPGPLPSPTSGTLPPPTATPSPGSTPTPVSCTTATLQVSLATAAPLAAAIVRIDYPEALSLPWGSGLDGVTTRVLAGGPVASGFFGVGGEPGSLILGALATAAALTQPLFATIRFDCVDSLPASTALGCVVDAANAAGESEIADCQLSLSP